MMTPEERARDLGHAPLQSLVAAAIREAVAAERERCAKIADAAAGVIAQRIAAAIRQDPPAEPNLANMRPNASGFCDP